MKNDRILNGYVVVHRPEHPKAMRGGNWDGYVYEHIAVAEEMIDRPIRPGDEVHHLDENRSNNSPDNLLVLSGPMHMKLHSWLEKHTIIPNDKQIERNQLGCIRCKVCSKPINHGLIYCGDECSRFDTRIAERPTREQLLTEIENMPLTSVAKQYGVSDNSIRKWCKAMNVELPKREAGYWTKKKFGLV